ncbi:bifunctional glutamate N-acetyltransferase/amino-acid acetyltransferase ArgJ [Allobaculum stercoricanis]|uniref:bifunctional glutamate N-acetyltransferase/amino-acid acetyltransferase ArgJ n=1 Tax=Allobaculum stercoricanis TaxID=174709 RepID=UPI000362B15B|nr:bifunctional glutamate N-acetyltransferase/amino-acid acetyltransferase ArgJ [Allobaculum stercoricanis]
MKLIKSGITAAKGFTTGAIHCGIRNNKSKKELALIVSQVPCQTAAVYTKNKVKAAPLLLNKKHLVNGQAQAICVNSGNANACAINDDQNSYIQAKAAAEKLGLNVEDVLVASTGVIGVELPIDKIVNGIKEIELTTDWLETAKAIMTTDTTVKECSVEFELDGKTVHLGGIAKGSGMIHPNMGTMLCFITTDAAISHEMLDQMLKQNVKQTFNRISVDGDTSTNDMCIVMANGLAQNTYIDHEGEDAAIVNEALKTVMEALAIDIAKDGEGASRLITVQMQNARSEQQAETLAMSVASSSLLKAAVFGQDANWGRVLCAMGYADTEFDPSLVDIYFASNQGKVLVCQQGKGIVFDEDLAAKILAKPEIEIIADLHAGDAQVTCWGCDLTYDYVKINGDYRT